VFPRRATRPSASDAGHTAGAQAGATELQGWYLAEAQRGQQLLDGAEVNQAIGVFQAILGRFGDAARYERAAILERLGVCFHLSGRPDLAAASLRQAMRITEALPPDKGVRALRGTLHSELGDVLRATGELGDARRAYEAALGTAQELKDLRAQSLELTRLGGLALVTGELEEAQTHYRAALELLIQLREPALEAAARHQLGRVLQRLRRWNEAEQHYLQAARLREARGNLAGAAREWSQLAALAQERGDIGAAEGWHLKAIDADRQICNLVQLGHHLSNFAGLLLHQPGRLAEARKCAEEALSIGQALDPVSLDTWRHYRILAEVADAEAAMLPAGSGRAELEARARGYRQLEQHALRIIAALARLDQSPSYGRAVILERLAQCFCMGERPDLAVTCLREAMAIAEKLESDDEGATTLRRLLHSGLGNALGATGAYAEAGKAFESALRLAEQSGDLLGQSLALHSLAGLAAAAGELQEAEKRHEAALRLLHRLDEPDFEAAARHQLVLVRETMGRRTRAELDGPERACLEEGRYPAAGEANEIDEPLSFEVTVREELVTDHVFEPDLLLDGPRERRVTRWTGAPDPLPDAARPMLGPCTRTFADEEGAVCFRLDVEEPILGQRRGCTIMRRISREVVVSGNQALLWRLIRVMDGTRTVADILSRCPAGERDTAARILAVLAATGAIDVSGRSLARFLHSVTKKGVLAGGGLEKDEVMRLAMDGSYRAWPGAPTLAVSRAVPDRLRSFHALTRARRSYREYLGLAVSREDFHALLHTACGVTGAVSREGCELRLRAYPSSGALYAVEIYPVVFRVEGLEPAVCHYRASENVVEVVRPGLDPARIVGAMLPAERGMVAGAAALICLTGFFSRHERKYGEGGYRMMVAEAGHLSQNLILAATELGLRARPFGGVFDGLLNCELGLDEAEEQFLLAVLVGRADGGGGP